MFISTSHPGALVWLARGQDRNLTPAVNYQDLYVCLSVCLSTHTLSVHLSPSSLHPQGFQVVCETTQSDSSSPSAGEQSCRRGNSVEKGGPSQQPPPVKGPSKKK